MSTNKRLAAAATLAGMVFSTSAFADDGTIVESVSEESTAEELPDGTVISTTTVVEISETPYRERFGQKGQWSITLSRMGGFSWSQLTRQHYDTNINLDETKPTSLQTTLFVASPAEDINAGLTLPRIGFDFFPVENFSAGVNAFFGFVRDDPDALTRVQMLSIGQALNSSLIPVSGEAPFGANFLGTLKGFTAGAELLFGYNLEFNDRISWWPKFGGEFIWSNTKYQGSSAIMASASLGGNVVASGDTPLGLSEEATFNGFWFTAAAPFVYSPINGWAITLGPTVDIPIVGVVETDSTVTVDGTATTVNTKINNKVLLAGAFMGAIGYW